MANKRKGGALLKQLDWLTEYLKNDKDIRKEQLLRIIRNDIGRNKWSKLSGESYGYLESILNEDTTAHAKRIITKYLGDPLPTGFHSIGLWYMNQFQDITEDFDEELRCETFGYLSEYGAFNDNRAPASILMHEYREKYIVWICDEMIDGWGSDYIPECNIFDTKEEADSYFNSLINQGIKDGDEQLQECLKNVTESDNVFIKPISNIYYDVDFRVYYHHNLIIEHMWPLSFEKINHAIEQYKNYCKENQVEIRSIYKKHPWNSNQRYYVIEYYDEKNQEYYHLNIHIPSEMQGQERNVIDLLKPNNIVENLE